jgi:UDP-N-acetyl-2-amino-2-deoxyglucuronate dehydrogenase
MKQGAIPQNPNFVLIGAAGYVAPRHMAAIKAVGGNLIAALDPHDSVGVLDSYFPNCRYFSEFERFDRFCELFKHRGAVIDYVSICSPNYLHDAHCRFALRIGADAICEKPLVLNARNIEALKQAEREYRGRIWNVLQIRRHPAVMAARASLKTGYHQAKIQYVAPRGAWYAHSWKGDPKKSGGIGTNIGIHLFDACCYLFGDPLEVELDCVVDDSLAGRVHLERAEVNFYLSTRRFDLQRRVFEIDGVELDLGGKFAELHTEVYRQILAGNGCGIDDALPAIDLAERVRELERKQLAAYVGACADA